MIPGAGNGEGVAAIAVPYTVAALAETTRDHQ
jgi:hypothetical protein